MYTWRGRVLLMLCVLLQFSYSVSGLLKPCPKFDVLYGRTRSRSRGRAMRVTCNRGYNLIGERTLLCNKGKWDSDVPVCARTGCPIPEARIPGGKVLASNRDQILRTVCEDGFELQGSAVIFCNGIVWNDTLPLCLGKPGVKACDFEGRDHFCGWHQTRNMLGWQMGYDPLENWVSNWAPDFDHTYGLGGFGHYVHMKGPSDEHPFYTSGQLKSPFYRKPDNPQVCFQFWFHVFGEEAGDLKVMVNREVVWFKEQINRKLWQRGAFHFVANSTYQIIIEASVPHSMVTVAVDDLEVIENCTHVPDYVLGSASSCEGRCDDDGSVDDCSCDSYCQEVDNCCPDWAYFCPSNFSGSDTTAVLETTVVTSQYSPESAVTTIIPDELESGTNSFAESTLNENINEQTMYQGQSEDNNNLDNSQNTMVTNLDNPDNNQNTMVINKKNNNNEGVNEQFQQTHYAERNPTGEESKTNENTKTDDMFHGTVSHNDLYLNKNVNEEIDVPTESPNESATVQVSDTSEVTGMHSMVDTNQETPKIEDTNNSDSIAQINMHGNDSSVSINVNDVQVFSNNQTEETMSNVTGNDPTLFEHGGLSLHPNLQINKKRMRESVKKSTVVYDAEETQLNPTENKTRETVINEFTGNGTERITPSEVFDNAQTKTDYTTTEHTSIVNEDQTLLEKRNNISINRSVTIMNLANTTDKLSLLNGLEPNKEKLEIIETKNSRTEIKKSDPEPSKENILTISKNEGNDNTTIKTYNETKSQNIESPANNYNLNRNYTKIILYKSSNSDNSTTTNDSNILHANDISRVQIHTNVQANGIPFVENVKMDDVGKYNESTIARLKQINDHINNVISKRNTTYAGNATSDNIESKNATVLHKLKHFITTIIDSHNNSTLMTNNTENMEKISNNVNVTVYDEHLGKSSLNVTRDDSTTGSISSDELILLTEKTKSEDAKTPQSSVQNVNLNVTNTRASGSGESRQPINLLSPGVSNIETQGMSSVFQPEQNATWFSSDINNFSKNFKLVRSYNEKSEETLVKTKDKIENTSGIPGKKVITSVDSHLEKDKNFSSEKTPSISKESTTTSEFHSLSTKKTFSQTSSTKKYFLNMPAIIPKPKFTVTKSIRAKPLTTSWKTGSKLASTLRRQNSSLAGPTLREGFYKPINKLFNSTMLQQNLTTRQNWYSNWRARRLSTTSQRTVELSSTSRTTKSGFDLFSINLLKTMSNNSAGNKKVNQAHKYEVWEETTGRLKEEHSLLSASSSNKDNYENNTYHPSLISILSLLLIVTAVIGSTVTSYYLVQKYRRPRPDDTEIAYLTGDELLYFRTPSPHRSSRSNARAENEDDVGTF